MMFANDAAASRYELRRGDELLSVLDYRDNGTDVALVRAFTNPAHRGHGYAAVVTERAVEEIAARGDRTVSPVCWYVADWFRDHPDRQELLAAR
ncbi:GNAT family N-acetyltransferase [Microbacterium sp.]|uniref:GNAT family N-acetyltransferase n=1 Tax=Microbacterium sp. TaxID=51671 RepID=UPI003F9A4745